MSFDLLPAVNRRQVLRTLAAMAAGSALPVAYAMGKEHNKLTREDEGLLDDLEKSGRLLFWEQGSPNTGQVLDRARMEDVREVVNARPAPASPKLGPVLVLHNPGHTAKS